jgi:isoaspartyl peptidase/L-asparaginase-like protein (Ntn-hydrolase superfamily)
MWPSRTSYRPWWRQPVPAEKADAYRRGCLTALRAGWAVLERGDNACDAVEAAICVFEVDETFNAAHGSFLNADGLIAVGTSTGGEDHNPPGRIGDSAQVGCGFYAENTLGGCAMS